MASKRKNPAAVALGRKGGKSWWAGLTAAERAEHVRKMQKGRARSRKNGLQERS